MELNKRFYSRGVPLDAIVSVPERSDAGWPGIILCHGHSRHKNDGLDRLAQQLTQAGFLVLRMDFRGCGDGAAARYELYCAQDWPEDLMSAISYLKTIPMLDPTRIGVAGISMGACTAVSVAGMDSRVRSTVAMAGIGDCRAWLQWVWMQNGGDFAAFESQLEEDSQIAAATGHSRFIESLEMYHMGRQEKDDLRREALGCSDVSSYVSLGALRSLLPYKPIEKCPYIQTPIFFACGSEDAIVPQRESEQMYAAVRSQTKKLKKYEGMEHNLPADPQHDVVFRDIVQWFKETL